MVSLWHIYFVHLTLASYGDPCGTNPNQRACDSLNNTRCGDDGVCACISGYVLNDEGDDCINSRFIIYNYNSSYSKQTHRFYTISLSYFALYYVCIPGAELSEFRHQVSHREFLESPPTLYVRPQSAPVIRTFALLNIEISPSSNMKLRLQLENFGTSSLKQPTPSTPLSQ